MQRYKITTPVAGHTEQIGTVTFVNGVAYAEADADTAALAYFRQQGYGLFVKDEDTGEWVSEQARTAQNIRAERIASLEAELERLHAEHEAEQKPGRPVKRAKRPAKPADVGGNAASTGDDDKGADQ